MCSFSAPRRLAEVLATLLGSGKVSGPCRRVVRRRRLLTTGGLGLWLEMGVSVWSTLGACVECIRGFSSHTPCLCANQRGWLAVRSLSYSLIWSVVPLETTPTANGFA